MGKIAKILVIVSFISLFSCKECHNPTGGVRPPIPGIMNYYSPAWGPNNIIAFAHTPWRIINGDTTEVEDSSGIWLINSDGTGKRLLIAGAFEDPRWTKDGKWIFMVNWETGAIWKISSDGDSLIKVLDPFYGTSLWLGGPSPDGKKLLFHVTMGDSAGQYMLNLETGKIKYFGYGESMIIGGYFHPLLGDRFVCTRDVGGRFNIEIVDTLGNTIKNFGYGGGAPTFSWNGEKIVFEVVDTIEHDFEVWVANADGTALRKVVEHGIKPSLSPDGNKIVYVRLSYTYINLPGNGKLWIVNVDGTNNHQLTF